MKIEGPSINYGKVVSHIFPGFILLVQVIVLFYQSQGINANEILKHFATFQWNTQIFIFLLFVFGGTICGVILDGLHHCIEDKILSRTKVDYSDREFHVLNKDQMEIYKYWVDEALLDYCEAYINTALALLPMFILLPFIWKGGVLFLLYPLLIIIIVALWCEFVETRKEYNVEHKKVMEYFQKVNKL